MNMVYVGLLGVIFARWYDCFLGHLPMDYTVSNTIGAMFAGLLFALGDWLYHRYLV